MLCPDFIACGKASLLPSLLEFLLCALGACVAKSSSRMFAAIMSGVPSGPELAAILLVVSFSAGLNVYATVAMLGILSRVGALSLPPTLHPVANTYVIAACALLFLIEFVADKIPVFDLLWNALQTFVRVPVAAVLAYGATSRLPEREQLLATLLGALIALAAHGGKVAARAAVTHSPEPFSNIALSVTEDAAVISLTWLATRHPYVSAAIVLALLFLIILAIRLVIAALRRLFARPQPALRPRPAQ
jgi:Domain of unknown function (DUF4126)